MTESRLAEGLHKAAGRARTKAILHEQREGEEAVAVALRKLAVELTELAGAYAETEGDELTAHGRAGVDLGYEPPPSYVVNTTTAPKSLRDEFAMAALVGLSQTDGAAGVNTLTVADCCYAIADAMMAIRSK